MSQSLTYDVNSLSFARLTREIAVLKAVRFQELRDRCERSLALFLREAWPHFDSSQFMPNWHLDAIAEHLQAVSDGKIKRLLINIPPRFGKTNLVAVAWPVWTWALTPDPAFPLHGPGVRFLCASYNATKAQTDGVTARRLIAGTWFQERWGRRVRIAGDRDNQSQYDTTAGGSRISTGIPESLGKGGAIRIIDDPHKTDEVESEDVRAAVIRAYDEVWRTRSNDPVNGAEVVVMQRLNEADLSGHLLREKDVIHLCLPLEYEARRHCHTVIGFDDPRRTEGELLWPTRYDRDWVTKQKRLVGPHAYQGQYQQTPTARGGTIILRDWWETWPPESEADSWVRFADGVPRLLFPDFEYVLLSVDTAYTEKEENDWSACTVWGVFRDRLRNPRVMLIQAWRERIELRGLVMRVLETARRRKAHGVLVEAKASGISVVQEMRRLMRREDGFVLYSDVPRHDKTARLHSVVPAFAAGLIYAPKRTWAEMVINEVAQFPRAKHDDLCLAAGTLIVTKRGAVPIEDVVVGDMALTPLGWRPVLAAGMTGYRPVVSACGLTGTGNHPVFDLETGLYKSLDTVTAATRIGTLKLCDLIRTIRLMKSSSTGLCIGAKAAPAGIISVGQDNQAPRASMASKVCMLLFGNMQTAGPSQMGIKSITGMVTHSIAALRIWSAYQRTNIAGIVRGFVRTSGRSHWSVRERLHRLGTSLLRAGHGIGLSQLDIWVWQGLPRTPLHPSRAVHAFGAVPDLCRGTAERSTAPRHVPRSAVASSAGNTATAIHTICPVYNLTVGEAHCYYANSVLVHNCDTVSAAISKLRTMGLLQHVDEVAAERLEESMYRGHQPTVREEYGV